jgi:hypothetical protein
MRAVPQANSIVLYLCGQQLKGLLYPLIEYYVRSEPNADETQFYFRNHENTHEGISFHFGPKTTMDMYQFCQEVPRSLKTRFQPQDCE